jgi:cell division initiation protein
MLTPQEILQRSFKRTFRGYDPDEVNAFLRAVAQEWESQLDTYRHLREDFSKLQSAYDTLKELENTLHRTLLQAEQTSRDMVDNARVKAELTLQQGEAEAAALIQKAKDDRAALEREIEELKRTREQMTIQLRVFLSSAIDQVSAFEKPAFTQILSRPLFQEPVPSPKPEPTPAETPAPPKAPEPVAPWKESGSATDDDLIDEITREL